MNSLTYGIGFVVLIPKLVLVQQQLMVKYFSSTLHSIRCAYALRVLSCTLMVSKIILFKNY